MTRPLLQFHRCHCHRCQKTGNDYKSLILNTVAAVATVALRRREQLAATLLPLAQARPLWVLRLPAGWVSAA
jgi:hypothetical protein